MPSRRNKSRFNRGKGKKGKNKQKSKQTKAHAKTNTIHVNQQNDDNKQLLIPPALNKCGYCTKQNVSSKCGGCKMVFYCNRDCQTKHWPKHKISCKLYQIQSKQIKHDLFAAKMFGSNDNYIKRIDLLLNVYQQFIDNNGKYDKHDDIYNLICAHYPTLKIDSFVSDYIKYVENVDNNNIYKQYYHQCDLNQCQYVQREYRDRNIYGSNTNQRSNLYHNSKSEESIVISQLLDALHVAKYHLADIGLRYIDDDANDDNNDDDEKKNDAMVTDKGIKTMISRLNTARTIFDRIRNDVKYNDENNKVTTMPNKFVTAIVDDNKDDEMPHYSFGFRFYYHSFYKNNATKKDLLPGLDNMRDIGNTQIDENYSYGDWYIPPKYKSIKEEILNGKEESLTVIQYNNTLKKARIKYDVLKKRIGGAIHYWEIAYGIKEDQAITLSHIFAVLLYTNWTFLSAAFTTTFRKLSPTETDETLKKRHCRYAIWGKLLRECVECWGTPLQTAAVTKFYHGISCRMIFAGFAAKFAGPTSTTILYSTALMFSSQGDGDGIVITIRNNKLANLFLNCVSFSDFPGEQEMLFIGGFHELEICGLTAIEKQINYDEWIVAMNIFHSGFIKGFASTIPILPDHKRLLDILIQNFLNNEEDDDDDGDDDNNLIPVYIQRLFSNLLNKTWEICLDPYRLKSKYLKNAYSKKAWGYKILADIYLTENNEIKWDVLKALYPSSKEICVMSRVKIPNQLNRWTLTKTISITDDLMKTLLSYLSHPTNKWEWIEINCPINPIWETNLLMYKYQALFQHHQFRLDTIKVHPQYGCSNDAYLLRIKPLYDIVY